MAVLVTGGAGYIGSHMVWELLDHGEEVVVIDNLSSGHASAVAPGAELVVGDIGDIALVGDLLRDRRIDSILHFAGSIVAPDSVDNPLWYYENNTAKSRSLIAAAVANGIDKFIYSSTAAVYGSPKSDGPVREDAILDPRSPYGSSKLMTEIMLRDTALAHGMRYVMLRYFDAAGADVQGRAGQSTAGARHAIRLACDAALGKCAQMPIEGTDFDTPDGTCVRDFIHVSDLVRAHYLALRFLRDGGRKFTANCGYSQGYSVREIVAAVERVAKRKLPTVNEPRRPGEAPMLVANAHRAHSRLGWEPRYNSLDLIVKTALDWERRIAEQGMLKAG